MKRWKGRYALLVLGGLILLLAAHGVVLGFLWSHSKVSAAVASGLIILALGKHLGLPSALFAALRRRPRGSRSDDIQGQ